MHAVSGLFHSHLWVLFAVPSRYYALSVINSYLALEGGPPVFAPGFTCPGLLLNRIHYIKTRKGLSPAAAARSRTVPRFHAIDAPAYPDFTRFGLLPLRSPLLRESRLISFPPGTGMFRFPGLASPCGDPRLKPGGFSHSDSQGSRAGAPRLRVSPLPASFVAGLCLGIPRVHFFVLLHYISTHCQIRFRIDFSSL